MDKVAYYKEYIYKEASAWKDHLGQLSRAGVQRLRKSGILDYGKELKGLMKGTDNIIKSVGGKAYTYGKNISDKGLDELGAKVSKHFGSHDSQSISALQNAIHEQNNLGNGFFSLIHPKPTVIKGQLDRKKSAKLLNLGDGMPRRKFHQKYLEAVLNRHEANEAKHGARLIKSNKTSRLATVDGVRVPTTHFQSHMTPRVLTDESVDVAKAPGRVKSFMRYLRSSTHEMDQLSDRHFDYGIASKFNSKASRHLENLENKAKSRPASYYEKNIKGYKQRWY